jgi:hypothetical protein
MPYLPDGSLDVLLNYVQDNVESLYICNAEPTDYTEASATFKLGTKVSPTVAEPSDRGGGGRECIVSAITDGAITVTDDATHWALCKDSATSELLAAGDLAALQAVTDGNTFTLAQFAFGVPDAV